MNPYIMFAMEERKRILKDQPHLKAEIGTVGKLVGKRWNQLSEAEKAKYRSKSRKAGKRKAAKGTRKSK